MASGGSRDPREYLRRLQRQAERSGDFVKIPQPHPEPPVMAPRSVLPHVFLNGSQRISGELPPDAIHPIAWACARSPDSTWSGSFYAVGLMPGEAGVPEVIPQDVPDDLSED